MLLYPGIAYTIFFYSGLSALRRMKNPFRYSFIVIHQLNVSDKEGLLFLGNESHTAALAAGASRKVMFNGMAIG